METVDIQAVNDALRKRFLNGQLRSEGARGSVQGEISDIYYDVRTSYLCVFFWWMASYREIEIEDDCIVGLWHIHPENAQRMVGAKIKMTPKQIRHTITESYNFGAVTIFEPNTKETFDQTELFPPGHEEVLAPEWIEGVFSATTH